MVVRRRGGRVNPYFYCFLKKIGESRRRENGSYRAVQRLSLRTVNPGAGSCFSSHPPRAEASKGSGLEARRPGPASRFLPGRAAVAPMTGDGFIKPRRAPVGCRLHGLPFILLGGPAFSSLWVVFGQPVDGTSGSKLVDDISSLSAAGASDCAPAGEAGAACPCCSSSAASAKNCAALICCCL